MYLFGKEGNQRGTGGSGSKVFLSLTPLVLLFSVCLWGNHSLT